MVALDSTRVRRADIAASASEIVYSICTLVTRSDEYLEMVASFERLGFGGDDCEFLYLDNTPENKFDGYAGTNIFLNVARGTYIILCHQDITLVDDDRPKLDAVLQQLTRADENWAVCGNAGGAYLGRLVVRISDPYGKNRKIGQFPAQVCSVDENFIVVRRSARLALSSDLHGFHFYGTDLCLIADILGHSCYVIDFHLMHKSAGSRDEAYFSAKRRFAEKYRKAFRPRFVQTASTFIYVSGRASLWRWLNRRFVDRALLAIDRKFPWLTRLTFLRP
jgi:hypothetical protein